MSIVKVIRNKDKDLTGRRVKCMELNPTFLETHPEWNILSLGEYLSQLEPTDKTTFNRLFLQKELEVTLMRTLLKAGGETFGTALLPLVGVGTVSGLLGKVAHLVSIFFSKCILTEEGCKDEVIDPLAFDMSLLEVISMINMNQKFNPPSSNKSTAKVTPLEYLQRGENAYKEAYDNGDGSFPMKFDVDKDFDLYVTLMEDRLREKGDYDPQSKKFSPSKPVHERLLPGLHIGQGDLDYTHTNRESIQHRLTCLLINKLAYNYYRLSQGSRIDDCFKVICDGKECLFPEEFIQALVDCGHRVEMCPRVIISTFGLELCVKEPDGWSYIPTSVWFRTGVENVKGKAAYLAAPHGGIDLRISGPIIGSTKEAWLQFYVSIGGLTCFHDDRDRDAPWAAKKSLAQVYSHDMAIQAMRMMGLISVAFNRIASELDLPYGGYGVLGMCNDSATLVDYALRGETNSYPLLSTGRYLNHIVDYLINFKEELQSNELTKSNLEFAVKDLTALIRSTSHLPSDLHITPVSIIDTAKRYKNSYLPVFEKTVEAEAILDEIAKRRETIQYLK